MKDNKALMSGCVQFLIEPCYFGRFFFVVVIVSLPVIFIVMCHERLLRLLILTLFCFYKDLQYINSSWRSNFELFHDTEDVEARQVALSVEISVSCVYPCLVLKASTDPPCYGWE